MAANVHLTSSIPRDLVPGLAQFAGLGYDRFEKMFDKVFMVEKSMRNFEERTLLSGLGVAQRVSEMDAVTYDNYNQRYTVRYTHTKYGLGILMSRESIEDSQSGLFDSRKLEELGASVAKLEEQDHANILINAFDSAYTGGDGVELCSTAHVSLVSSTNSNRLASNADLSEASLEQMRIEMYAMLDEKGNKINVLPTKLVVAPANEFNAYRLLNSTGRPGTPDNDPNAIKAMGLIKDLIVWPYLTDADAFFMLTNIKDGLTSFNRRSIEFNVENDSQHDAVRAMCLVRFSNGWTDWRGIFGTPGA